MSDSADKKCIWELVSLDENYKTSCGNRFSEDNYLEYEILRFCPFCGKEIKESEFKP